MLTNDEFELLEAYAEGNLKGAENEKVRDNIASKKEWNECFEQLIEVNKRLKATHESEKLKAVLNEVSGKINTVEQIETSKKKANVEFYIAASIFAVILCVAVMLFNNQTSNSEVFADNYTTYTKISTVRGGSINTSQFHLNAAKNYNNRNYKDALIWFDKILAEDGFVAKYELYKGICLIELGEYEGAKKSFDLIINDGKSVFVNDAKWYKGLCFLKLDNRDDAILLFNDVANSSSVFSSSAGKALKQME